MSGRKIMAIIEKQIKDTFKNKEVLIQFLMFPCMALVMEHAVVIPEMPEHFFVKLFSAMYIGMAPLVSMASIVAEEKEKNTLLVLLMSDVKPREYLLGIGSYVSAASMAGSGILALAAGFGGRELAVFLAVMCLGIVISLLWGAAVGAFSRNQMGATSITVPIMMVFSFLPMLGMFNETIKKLADCTFSGRIHGWISHLGSSIGVQTAGMDGRGLFVVAGNLLLAVIFFWLAYRKNLKN